MGASKNSIPLFVSNLYLMLVDRISTAVLECLLRTTNQSVASILVY